MSHSRLRAVLHTVGTGLGALAAVYRGGVLDWFSLSVALIGISGWGPDELSPGEEATVLRALTSRLSRALRG